MSIWTATIVSSKPISPIDIVEMYDIGVQYDCDDGRTTTRSYRLSTQAQLQNQIRNQLGTFNGIDLDALALGPIDVSPAKPPDLTPEQIKARDYAQAKQKAAQLKADNEISPLLASAEDVTAAIAEAAALKG